jgi:hypothetical protein
MAKITPRQPETVIQAKTKDNKNNLTVAQWWKAGSSEELSQQLIGTAVYLKDQSQFRYRQSSLYARLYGNMPLFGYAGTNLTRMNTSNQLPIDRPTMSVITSCIDTLVSRISQSRPRPVFLTDAGDYKQRKMAKDLNAFMDGELYQTKAHAIGEQILRDACVLGTGVIKVLEDQKKRVSLERVMCTELLVDPNDSLYGNPRQIYQFKLVDRSVLEEMFPNNRGKVTRAEQAYPDSGGESSKTVSDMVMVVEGWHLPSGPDANDGRHTIACSSGVLFDEDYKKDRFPFVFLNYAPRMLGFWGQGVAERLMGTQVEINKLLMTISNSINLVGVPRIFVEEGSKIVKAHLNNSVGSIVTYRGTPPQYTVAPCVPAELYDQLQRLINYAYQQEGISQLAANSQKPAGLTSGTAMREYDDLQTDRFASLVKRYDNLFVDLAYIMIDLAREIAERDGKYQTVYPNKDGTKEVDLPHANLVDNPFVIQCYDSSSLPRDPAARKQQVIEDMQAGLLDPDEGRRLIEYPDLSQNDKLQNAAEERILKILDDIVEEGKYTPPDPFTNLQLASKLCTEYYNLYSTTNLEESKLQMLRDYFSQINLLVQAATPPPPPVAPMAGPEPRPISPMVPNVPVAG